MTPDSQLRIFIVEDHPVVRHGYELLIATEPLFEICGWASGEQEAMDGIRDLKPDVAIVDLTLDQGGSGLELIRQLGRHLSDVSVLVVSASDEELYASRVLQHGALGFLSKNSGGVELLDSIRAVANGEVVVSPKIANHMLKDRIGRSNSSAGLQSLTDRELQVLQSISDGCSRAVIAERLFISPRTVERHCENIRRKLGLSSNRELLRYATLWSESNG